MKNNSEPVWAIMPAKREHVKLLHELETSVFTDSCIGERSFARLTRSASSHVYVALNSSGELLGYYILLTRSNSKKWRLYSIASKPSTRGSGLGRALLEHAIELAKQHLASCVVLEVKTTNTTALALYTKRGFEVIDILKSYYDDNADGYRMQLSF